MPACTFFGHRDCGNEIFEELNAAVNELIVKHGVDRFYVGRQGNFDRMAYRTLSDMHSRYPHIKYEVVLEKIPVCEQDCADTVVPDGVEGVHPRYAVCYRNKWMIDRSDYVIVYVKRSWGDAARYAALAERMRRNVIYIKG